MPSRAHIPLWLPAALALAGALSLAPAHAQFARPWLVRAAPAQPAPPAEPEPAPEPAPEPTPEPDTDDGPPEATVLLRDGQRVTGELIEDGPTRVVLLVRGVEVSFSRDSVRSVQMLPSVSEQYRQLRDTIDPKDADSLVRLADWLRSRGRLAEALAEVNRALAAEPAHPRGLELRTIVEQQIKLAAARGRPEARTEARAESRTERPGEEGPERESRPGPDARPAADQVPLLTPEQVNLIRVYETDLRDPTRMSIAPGTIATLIETYTGDPLIPATREGKDRLFRAPPAEILDLLFRLRARELYGGVRVLEPPRAVRLFRDDVHRGWLLNSCATSDCHGGAQAGRLRLARSRASSDAAVTTNLYILDQFRTIGGEPLIDYDKPASSILVQHGLPMDLAAAPHPRVDGWRPAFRGPDDPRLERTLAWIRAMYRPRPDYGIDYTPVAPFSPPDPESPAPEAGPRR